MCPSKKVDPTYNNINNISELEKFTKDKIKYFFSHYKDLENKNVTVGEFKSKEKAIQVYQDCIKKYQLNNID